MPTKLFRWRNSYRDEIQLRRGNLCADAIEFRQKNLYVDEAAIRRQKLVR